LGKSASRSGNIFYCLWNVEGFMKVDGGGKRLKSWSTAEGGVRRKRREKHFVGTLQKGTWNPRASEGSRGELYIVWWVGLGSRGRERREVGRP